MKSASVVLLLVLLTIATVQPALASKSSVNFAKAVSYASGGLAALSVAVGDLNGDGKPDLAVVSRCHDSNGDCVNSSVSILLGNGDGTFQSPTSYFLNGYFAVSVAIGDLNGDGKPDLVVADSCQTPVGPSSCNGPPDVNVLLGNGDGTFRPPVSYATGGFGATSVTVADLNRDGHLDLVVGNNCYDEGCTSQGSPVGVLLGKGDGTFHDVVVYDAGGDHAASVAVEDVNGDGKPDLLVADVCEKELSCPGAASVLLGNGDGTFQPAVVYSSSGEWSESISVGDVNGDGHPDLVLANLCESGGDCTNGSVSVLLGNGNGTFQAAVTYISGGIEAMSVAIGDVNGDGRPDIVVANLDHVGSNVGYVGILVGNGDGTFKAPATYASGGLHAQSVAIRDVNGDGELDLLVANQALLRRGNCCAGGSVGVLLNKEATTTKVKSSLNPSQVNQSVTFTATITSITPIPDGETVTFYAGTTKLGTGTTANGVATFTTSFSIAGTYGIKAKYPGDTLHLKSQGSVKQVVNP